MKEILLKFLQDNSGLNSSKRLMGISSGYVLCLLTFVGGLIFLWRDNSSDFNATLWILVAYSLGLFGVTAYEKRIEKKSKK